MEFKELMHIITGMGRDMAYFTLLLGRDDFKEPYLFKSV